MKRQLCGILALSLVVASVSAAQGKSGKGKPAKGKAKVTAPVTGAFIIRLGYDTVAIEQFSRTNERLQGDIVFRSPATRVLHYDATLAPDGSVTRLESATRQGAAAPDAPPVSSSVMTWSGDTAVVETRRGDSTVTRRIAARANTIPSLANSYALYEMALRQALRTRGDSVAMPMVPIGGQAVAMLSARRVGKDTVYLTTPNGMLHARLDRNGDIRGGRVVTGTQQFTAERVKLQDFPALVARFVARDAAGARMGALSPPDSVMTKVGMANVTINYSKPARRGRTVFGSGIAPWGKVWRTGANAATSFKTDADLMIGETLVPAGSYTLFSVPEADGWTLIINKQTGQWGTVHDEKQDLARIPMQLMRLSAPVEQFVIAVDQAPQGNVLRMAWDDRQGTVRIAPR